MSELRTNRIVPRDGLPSGTFGGIIQVVQTVKQDYQTININMIFSKNDDLNLSSDNEQISRVIFNLLKKISLENNFY